MGKGFFKVPKAVNEPVKGYAPGSPERKAVLEVYKELWNTKVDVPLYIGKEEYDRNVPPSRSQALAWYLPQCRQRTCGKSYRRSTKSS